MELSGAIAAAALGTVLVSQAAGAPGVPGEATLPDPLDAGWRGEPVCERLHEDASLRVLRCTFPPGGGHERHFHAPHFGYVLAGGRMRITEAAGVREVDLRAGSWWSSEGVPWHEVLNVGDTTSVYLVIEPLSQSTRSARIGSNPAARRAGR